MVLRVVCLAVVSFLSVTGPCSAALKPYCSSYLNGIVVVDGFSTGRRLALKVSERNLPVIHLQTAKEIPPLFSPSFRPEDYDLLLRLHDRDPAAMAEALAPFKPIAIVPGTETGVTLADHLSEILRLPTNGRDLSTSRRNKFDMIETIRRAGLRAAMQIRSANLEELIAWKQTHFPNTPVILKPVSSAGTDTVILCHSAADIERGYHAIMNGNNLLGLANNAVLLQEYLQGTEYIVETLSANGAHRHAYDWKYISVPLDANFFLNETTILMPAGHPHEKALEAYAFKVLSALGVRFGPAHIEIKILDGSGEPVLVELNARMGGADLPHLVQQATGFDEVEATLDSYLHPWRFLAQPLAPKTGKAAYQVSIRNKDGANVMSGGALNEIQQMPSYHSASWHYKDGDPLPLSRDLHTIMGDVNLIHSDPRVVERDFQRLRQLESDGAFHQ